MKFYAGMVNLVLSAQVGAREVRRIPTRITVLIQLEKLQNDVFSKLLDIPLQHFCVYFISSESNETSPQFLLCASALINSKFRQY